ncbi:MAG TPA: hypothetical protein VFG39_00255 [Balneolaceae bacterium]|nr:hypothetical protein [Balneolaceae bacterium]
MNLETRNKVLSIVLGVIIVVLGYILYHSIVDPYQVVIERQEMTEKVRKRMSTIRDVLILYERQTGEFPPSMGGLDTLVQFIKTDTLEALNPDSIAQGFPIDSLIYSPRPPHPKFEYALNDTLRPAIYLLKDPATEDNIGSLSNTIELNAASWE